MQIKAKGVKVYRLNPLQRNVLITTDEVIFHANTKHTLDPRMILNSIIIAEERLIRPALGYDFYFALCDEKNKLVTDGNKSTLQNTINTSLNPSQTQVKLNSGDIVNALEYLGTDNQLLWKQYLWKLVAECVMLAAYPDGYVQFSSEGTIHAQPAAGPMNSSGVVTPELRSMKWAMDKKMMDRIDPLTESMHLWICKQQKADKTKYPLYKRACDCNSKGVAYQRKTDILLGIYDDRDEHRRRDPHHFTDRDCDCE